MYRSSRISDSKTYRRQSRNWAKPVSIVSIVMVTILAINPPFNKELVEPNMTTESIKVVEHHTAYTRFMEASMPYEKKHSAHCTRGFSASSGARDGKRACSCSSE